MVAARLGHADPAVTLRAYSYVLREHAACGCDARLGHLSPYLPHQPGYHKRSRPRRR